jgi:hypothetical protein
MGKLHTRDFFILMRGLTAKGATIVILGHTTKRPDGQGKQIFDGVGDIRNDTDELIYVESTVKNADGIVTITMNPDKVRCLAKSISFKLDTISSKLEVLDDFVDVAKLNTQKSQFEIDKPIIELVIEELGNEKMPITNLVNQVKKHQECILGSKNIKALIERYLDSNPDRIQTIWHEIEGRTNNSRIIANAPF